MIRRGDWFFFHNEMVMDRRCFALRNLNPRIILCRLFHCQGWNWFKLLNGFAFGSVCLFCLAYFGVYVVLALLLAVELWLPFFFLMIKISLVVLALFRDKVSDIIINVFALVFAFLW